MRCRQARRLLSPFLEGELGDKAASEVRGHLAGCPACARRFRVLSEVVRELTLLPQVGLTSAEASRLHLRLEEALSAPHAAPTSRPLLRWAAVAACLVAAVCAASTWVLLSVRRAVTPVGKPSGTGVAPQELASQAGTGTASSLSLKDVYPENAEELVVRPALVLSGREYSAGELQSYGEDIGSRMAFYSAYWYPIQGDTRSPYLPRLQEQLISELLRQAEQAGLNPLELRQAITTVLAEAEDPLLPCRAELARIEGREAWLISLSGPEDYLLFPDPQVPAALQLAARGGQEILRLSQSILQELASYLIPQGGEVSGRGPGVEGEAREAEAYGRTETGGREPAGAPEARPGIASEEDFQAFLREVAAQGNPAEAVAALQALNYEQLLLLLQGDWSALAARGVDLSDFLLPPRRLAAVERNAFQVIWKAF